MNEQSSGGKLSWGNGYVISTETPNYIIGKVLTIIEAAGLNAKQEDSVKSLITRSVWDIMQEAIYITAKRHDEIREEHQNIKIGSKGFPVPAV